MNKYDEPDIAAYVGHMSVTWPSPMALTLGSVFS